MEVGAIINLTLSLDLLFELTQPQTTQTMFFITWLLQLLVDYPRAIAPSKNIPWNIMRQGNFCLDIKI